MDTETFLEALGSYLADVGLAQWSSDGGYTDDPDKPAILFGDADVPDTCLVLVVVGHNRSLSEYDVVCAFRATGVNALRVETLADAVSDHFTDTFGFGTGTWSGGTLVVPAKVTLPGGLVLREVVQTTRGTAELTSQAKHKGTRFVRVDQYKMTVR